jgi:hypothetical protein
MKIELGYTMSEGYWLECALCGEGFTAYEVEARTKLPGEYCRRAVCRGCVLAGEQRLKQRLRCRAWKLRPPANRLERAREEGIEVPSLGELHNLERRSVGRVRTDLLGSDEP